MTIEGPKQHSLKDYEYYAYSTRDEIIRQKEWWNSAFRKCRLASKKKEIQGMVRSNRDDQLLPALFELYLYEFFHRNGLKVRTGTELRSHHPDFKVIHPAGLNFHLEATCNMGDTLPNPEQAWRNSITDIIRSTSSSNFRVRIRYGGVAPVRVPPPVRDFRHKFTNWVAQLDYPQLLKRSSGGTWDALPEKKFDELYDFEVYARPIPLAIPKCSADHGLICSSYEGTVGVDTGKRLHEKLKDKAEQLKGARLPAVIAVNELAEYLDEDDILTALFGELSCEVVPRRGPNGFWTNGRSPRNQHVQAIMLFNRVGFFATPFFTPSIILNPFVDDRRIPLDLQFFDYFLPTSDGLGLGTPPARVGLL